MEKKMYDFVRSMSVMKTTIEAALCIRGKS